jgi:hypothetical protein
LVGVPFAVLAANGGVSRGRVALTVDDITRGVGAGGGDGYRVGRSLHLGGLGGLGGLGILASVFDLLGAIWRVSHLGDVIWEIAAEVKTCDYDVKHL